MKITEQILDALRKAIDAVGGQNELARLTGVGQQNISRYLSGKINAMDDSTWQKLLPALKPYMAAGTLLYNQGGAPEFYNCVVCRAMDCVHHDIPMVGLQCGKLRPFIGPDGKCESYIRQPQPKEN